MKRSQVVEIVKEILDEMNVTGAIGPTATPNIFSKKGLKKNAATTTAIDQGFTPIKRPKRPSDTGMFVYLDENK